MQTCVDRKDLLVILDASGERFPPSDEWLEEFMRREWAAHPTTARESFLQDFPPRHSEKRKRLGASVLSNTQWAYFFPSILIPVWLSFHYGFFSLHPALLEIMTGKNRKFCIDYLTSKILILVDKSTLRNKDWLPIPKSKPKQTKWKTSKKRCRLLCFSNLSWLTNLG